MAVRVQFRGGTAAEWTSVNPILAVREMGIDTDSNRYKIGDGVHTWNQLPYATANDVKIQYSITGSAGTWHDVYVPGDDYMHFSTDGGVTWGNAMYIRGEQGIQGPQGEQGIPGVSPILYYKTVGPTGSGADYECDGIADDVQINQAIYDISTTGGIVRLFAGLYNLADDILLTGDADSSGYDSVKIALVGSGINVTKIVAATNVNAIEITDAAIVKVADMTIKIDGTGNGIYAYKSTVGDNLRSFWQSEFSNLYFEKTNYYGTHTGWAMNLGSFFRSKFSNIEIFNVHNGIRLFTESGFNIGDSIFSRTFVELDNVSEGVGICFDSPENMGNVNQVIFDQLGLITDGLNCTAILMGGLGEGVNWNKFYGVNCEQFGTIIDISNGGQNEFSFNYICLDDDADGTFFKFAENAYGNIINSIGLAHTGNANTNVFIDDSSTNSDNPNIIQYATIGVESGSTLNNSMSSTTRVIGLKGYVAGTVASDLIFQKYPGGLEDNSDYMCIKGALPVDADYNNYTIPGLYTILAKASHLNGPDLEYGMLEVHSNGNYLRQFVYNYDGSLKKERFCDYWNDQTWTQWRLLGNGESAYDQAVTGGYMGKLTDFYADLAAMNGLAAVLAAL